MNPAEYYHRNFVITGIPRSGTSLMCKLVNLFDNAYCANEIWYNVDLLPGWFANVREMIANGQPVPNRYDNKGELTSNTMKDGEQASFEKLEKPHGDDILIGSKVNAPYLYQLEKIVFNRINIIGIIRHPVYVIGSYQMPYTSTLNIANPFTDPRYRNFKFKSNTKIEAQAELWEFFANVLDKWSENIELYRYEDITMSTREILAHFARQYGLTVPKLPDLKNNNKPERYKDIQTIRDAVQRWCPSMEKFGYEYND